MVLDSDLNLVNSRWMTLEAYRFLHLIGVLMILLPLSAAAFYMIQGGARPFVWKRLLAIVHGFGMLITFVAGFGLLAKLGTTGLPSWAILKLVIWLVLGGLIGLIYRLPSKARFLWVLIFVLALSAAALGIFQP